MSLLTWLNQSLHIRWEAILQIGVKTLYPGVTLSWRCVWVGGSSAGIAVCQEGLMLAELLSAFSVQMVGGSRLGFLLWISPFSRGR